MNDGIGIEINRKGDMSVEGLLQIGNALPFEEGSLTNFIKEIEPKKNKQLNVLKLNFDLEKQVTFDTKEEIDNETAYKYNFIGSEVKGSSMVYKQYTINYFISETIYNLSQLDLGEDPK